MRYLAISFLIGLLFFGVPRVNAQTLPPLPDDTANLIDEDQAQDIDFEEEEAFVSEDTKATTESKTSSTKTATTTTDTTSQDETSLSDTGQNSFLIGGLASFLAAVFLLLIMRRKRWNERL